MANFVMNKIEFSGEQKCVEKVLSFIRGDESDEQYIDFNKIIPMPDNIFRGDLGAKEREIYGNNNWYDWSKGHWGTKWNAFNQTIEDNTICFYTSWSMPYPIYEKLAKICYENNVTFEGEWVNEDWSSDSGSFETMEDVLIKCDDETEEEHRVRCISLCGIDPMEDEE